MKLINVRSKLILKLASLINPITNEAGSNFTRADSPAFAFKYKGNILKTMLYDNLNAFTLFYEFSRVYWFWVKFNPGWSFKG